MAVNQLTQKNQKIDYSSKQKFSLQGRQGLRQWFITGSRKGEMSLGKGKERSRACLSQLLCNSAAAVALVIMPFFQNLMINFNGGSDQEAKLSIY